MIQTITKEWQIAKAYIYEVASQDGIVNLGWDDFQMLAESHRPLVAVKVDEDVAVDELVAKAMNEIRKNCWKSPSGFIVSISCKKDDGITMDEMLGINDCMDNISDGNVEIRWGVSQSENLGSRRCIFVFAFE